MKRPFHYIIRCRRFDKFKFRASLITEFFTLSKETYVFIIEKKNYNKKYNKKFIIFIMINI